MMPAKIPALLRRTFEAAKHPKPSVAREALNADALTSEYQTSYRYMLRTPAMMSDGTPHPTQKFHDAFFRTKAEAVAAQNFFKIGANV